MTKISLLITLLLQLCTMMQGLSPCSEYYIHIAKPGANEILGQIEIPSASKNFQYYLKVDFNTHPLIHKNKPVARLEIAQPVEEFIQAVEKGRPLIYHVHFPVGQAIPRLTKIWFNDQQLCLSPEETENITTTVELRHVYVPDKEPPLLNSPSHQNSTVIGNSSSTAVENLSFIVTENSTPAAQSEENSNNAFLTVFAQKFEQSNNSNNNNNNNINNDESNNNCGISSYTNRTNLLINNGEETMPGQWPWLVALFVVRKDYEFKCAGSILTTKHVITAAHCLKLSLSSNDTAHPNILVVALGRFNLRQWRERGAVNREVASYKIHPDYTHTTTGDSDLAILTLRTPVEFSPFIRPICLWFDSTNLQNVINKIGWVVGWGEDELGHRYTEAPRMARVPIVSQETCLRSHQVYIHLTSERTFCAGLRDHSGPCNGDSGSGLVLFDAATDSVNSTIESALDTENMWLHCGILIYLFGFLLAKFSSKTFDDAGRHPSSLERKLTLKLKTAARLKHNLGKVLHELPVQTYEMHHSVKIIEDYLKNGGSLLECLDVLPSVIYAPIAEQMDSILGSMEDRLPEYLLPAISLIRRSLSEGLLDVDEIYRPTFGALKVDPFEKISVRELKEASSSLTYRATIKDVKGPWPKIVGETAALIHDKIIPPSSELIAYMLANLRIPDATTEVRESVAVLVEHLRSHGKHKLTGFSMSSDPYVLVANAVSSLSLQNETLIAANLLLPFLRKLSECRGSVEFANLFQNNILNYTLLISRDRMISRSKDGIAFLSMIQQNNTDVLDIIEQFSPFEYVSWKDLLLAFVSQLRRQQTHQGEVSNVVDSVYGELILRSNRKRWQLLRNSIIAAPVLSAIARRENSVRIRRLLMDVAVDRTVKLEIWRKALVFASSGHISGPINAVLKTLKALLASGLLPNGVLSMNIAELITTFDNRLNQGQAECSNQLETYLANFTQVEIEINRKKTIEDVDVKDLLQALPGLDTYTDEYRSLESFLSQSDLETKIGQIDLNAHPTRGRLLGQLLQMMIERANNNLRRLAEQLVDNVAYEGYGAGALSYRSS